MLKDLNMWLQVLLVGASVFTGTRARGQYSPRQWCCYGDRVVIDGEVAHTVADCCLQLVCENGQLVERHVGQPGSSNCCLGFNDELHPSGYTLAQCFPLLCKDGEWVPTRVIDDCCKRCSAFTINHFITHDGHHYDWNGVCNYTLTQQGSTYKPQFGVFTEMQPCSVCGACPSHTTFRNDENTVLSVSQKSLFNIIVNGEPFSVPATGVHSVQCVHGRHNIFSWRHGSCLVLVGSSSITVKICYNRVDVWAHRSLAGSLHGLCGYYNTYIYDDFTDREGKVHPLSPWANEDYAVTWRTNMQTNYMCNQIHKSTAVCNGRKGPPCHAQQMNISQYHHSCKQVLFPILREHPDLHFYIDTCTADLCLLHQADHDSDKDGLGLFKNLADLVKSHIEEKHLTQKNLFSDIENGTIASATCPSTTLPPHSTSTFSPFTTHVILTTTRTTPYIPTPASYFYKDTLTYTAPTYTPPSYTAPTYTPPSYTPPSNAAPIYTPPSYAAPTYTPPSYTPPTYTYTPLTITYKQTTYPSYTTSYYTYVPPTYTTDLVITTPIYTQTPYTNTPDITYTTTPYYTPYLPPQYTTTSIYTLPTYTTLHVTQVSYTTSYYTTIAYTTRTYTPYTYTTSHYTPTKAYTPFYTGHTPYSPDTYTAHTPYTQSMTFTPYEPNIYTHIPPISDEPAYPHLTYTTLDTNRYPSPYYAPDLTYTTTSYYTTTYTPITSDAYTSSYYTHDTYKPPYTTYYPSVYTTDIAYTAPYYATTYTPDTYTPLAYGTTQYSYYTTDLTLSPPSTPPHYAPDPKFPPIYTTETYYTTTFLPHPYTSSPYYTPDTTNMSPPHYTLPIYTDTYTPSTTSYYSKPYLDSPDVPIGTSYALPPHFTTSIYTNSYITHIYTPPTTYVPHLYTTQNTPHLPTAYPHADAPTYMLEYGRRSHEDHPYNTSAHPRSPENTLGYRHPHNYTLTFATAHLPTVTLQQPTGFHTTSYSTTTNTVTLSTVPATTIASTPEPGTTTEAGVTSLTSTSSMTISTTVASTAPME